MIRRPFVILALLVCLFSPSLTAKGGGAKGSGGHAKSSGHGKSHTSKAHSKSTAPRTTNGRIKRSAAAKHEFEVRTGYPHGRPGYVVDHIVPLACGGADTPGNMQWQTIAEAKAKDRTERLGCR